jgi:hypothetical protein
MFVFVFHMYTFEFTLHTVVYQISPNIVILNTVYGIEHHPFANGLYVCNIL